MYNVMQLYTYILQKLAIAQIMIAQISNIL